MARACLLVLGPAGGLGGRPGQGGAQHQQGEHGGGGGDDDQARPAGHGRARQGGDGDGDRGDDQLGGRVAPAAGGGGRVRCPAAAVRPGWRAWSAARRWRGRRGRPLGLVGGQLGGELVERRAGGGPLAGRDRVGGEPRLVEQRGQPAGGGTADGSRPDGAGEQLVRGVGDGAAGAPVGQAALHRHVAGDDRGPGVADLGQRGASRLHRLPQLVGPHVLDDQRRGRLAEPGGPPDADHHRRHQRDHQETVEDGGPRDVQRPAAA